MGKFYVSFHPQTAIKGQALVDFIAKFTYADTAEVARMVDIVEATKVVEAQGEKNSALEKGDTEQWTLYMDDASNNTRIGAIIMLVTPE